MANIPVHGADTAATTWQEPTEGSDMPYSFVPNRVDLHAQPEQPAGPTFEPTWHDGANADEEHRLSGELRCTLTTLTPTLCGNQQVTFSELTPEVQQALAQCAGLDGKDNGTQRKKLIFPLQLGTNGPVLLPPESLKGMLRHVLGALLAAPIERVNGGTFSYRPNATIGRDQQGTSPVAAAVEFFDQATCTLRLRLIPNLDQVGFVKAPTLAEARTIAPGTAPGASFPMCGPGWVRQQVRGRQLWLLAAGAPPPPARRWLFNYGFGLDQDLLFMEAAGRRPAELLEHPFIVVDDANLESAVSVVEPAVVAQYLLTRKHLCDTELGHPSRMPKQRQQLLAGVEVPLIKAHDVIFCEWDNVTGQVVSFGRNFLYRWGHLDSVTDRAIAFNDASNEWVIERRPEVRAHPDERPGPDGRPLKLSAVRSMMGYVVDGENLAFGGAREGDQRLLALDDPFDRLAGRIAVNMALERVQQGETAEQRFLQAGQGKASAAVFLHPTVSPKPSSFRTYVPGAGRSWGDALAVATDQVTGLDRVDLQNGTALFAGRKFYPHQGEWDVASGTIRLPRYHFDLLALIQHGDRATLCSHPLDELTDYLKGDQAAIAWNVSLPGRCFGFTVRFKALSRAELAALVCALDPGRLVKALKTLPNMDEYFQESRAVYAPSHARWAHKLGHGRALGMGSVGIAIDAALQWTEGDGPADELAGESDLTGTLDQWICDDLLPLLEDRIVAAWLGVLRLPYPGRARRPYLLHQDENSGQPQTPTAWSQAWRRQHSINSRQAGF